MNEHELSESEVERLLTERNGGRQSASPIEAAIDEIRANYRSDVPPVGSALAEFVDVGLITGTVDGVAASQLTDVPLQPLTAHADNPSRRNSMRAALATFAGSITGKIVLGGTLTFAAAGGAQAAGIVDLPGIPQETSSSIVTVEFDDEQLTDDIDEAESAEEAPSRVFAEDEIDDAEYEKSAIEAHRSTIVDLEIGIPAVDDDSDDQGDDDSDEADHHDSDSGESHHDSDKADYHDSDDSDEAHHDSDEADDDSDEADDHDSDEADDDSDEADDHDSDEADDDSDEADDDSDEADDHDSDEDDHDSDDDDHDSDDDDHDSDEDDD